MLAEGAGPKAPAGGSSPKEDAASDVLAAIKSNDAKALSLALERVYEASADRGDDDEDEDEEPVSGRYGV